MKGVTKLENWSIRQCEAGGAIVSTYEMIRNQKDELIYIGKPEEAQAALIEKGRLGASVIEDGEAEYLRWVEEKDWIYSCEFNRPQNSGMIYLNFEGLDTVCDIYLNGKRIAESKSMYLPLRLEVSGLLRHENELIVYFHSLHKLMDNYSRNMPEEWKGVIRLCNMFRKATGDFSDYYGAKPYFTPIGICGNVYLEMPDEAEITQSEITYELNPDYSEVIVNMSVAGRACGGEVEAEFELCEENSASVFCKRVKVKATERSDYHESVTFKLQNPKMWWPRKYGDQSLYLAGFTVYVDGVKRDYYERLTGFRDVKVVGSLKFRVNGVLMKFWGSNIAPIGSISHRWNPESAVKIMDNADKCNFNMLRIWGPGEVYGDELYAEADRRGIMIWQDFFHEFSQLPDSEEYMKLYLAEAANLIRRIKNHPSILLWCGSNETLFMAELFNDKASFGHKLLTHEYRKLCLELDPTRYYHDSSPSGGEQSSDPLFGDTHGSHGILSYVPGEEYAVFYTENITTFPPELKSLKRFIKEKHLWPEGFVDSAVYGKPYAIPPALERRAMVNALKKLGPIEQFYDATDAGSLIYKLTAAAGLRLYKEIADTRRGKPAYDSAGERRSNGHLIWKFNATWPQFYCALVDYYGEKHIPYYSVRRAFEPFLLTFDVKDHVYVWGVNDTAQDVMGKLCVKLFDISRNQVIMEFTKSVAVPAGESAVLTNLDSFRYFKRDNILFAALEAPDGRQVGRAVGYVDIERHIDFPQAEVKLEVDNGILKVTADKFARCIELSGNDDGDEFGWHFEDNYFDLLPFETKLVSISGKHTSGTVYAKAHYSKAVSEVSWAKPL